MSLYDLSDDELEKMFREAKATEEIDSSTLDNSTENTATQDEPVDEVLEENSSEPSDTDVGQLGDQDAD